MPRVCGLPEELKLQGCESSDVGTGNQLPSSVESASFLNHEAASPALNLSQVKKQLEKI